MNETPSITKVKAQDNVAEVGTKCLERPKIDKLKKALGIRTLAEFEETQNPIQRFTKSCVSRATFRKGLTAMLSACGFVCTRATKEVCRKEAVELHFTMSALLTFCTGVLA